MAEITKAEIAKIVTDTVEATIRECEVKHVCHFREDERRTQHALHEALSEEGANHGTLRIIIQMGKSWQDVTKAARKFGMFVVLVILAALAGKLWVWK